MSAPAVKITVLGLSITSSWGNGHATTYRGLIRELAKRGHDVLFLERDVPWYAQNRDLPDPPYGSTKLYSNLEDLKDRFAKDIRESDLVMLGSYVPDGVAVGRWISGAARGLKAFYDIDTPVTLAKLAHGDYEYIDPALIPCFDMYFSFTGGPTLARLQSLYGARNPRVLYCSTDPEVYFPEEREKQWDLGYLGTYSEDRQAVLDSLMLDTARTWREGRFVVAGPLYPATLNWPENVARTEHLPPPEHRAFYNSQRFTLSVTRLDMIKAGYSPSVRLFEAAACATPIITDYWNGLDTIFRIGEEILVARTPADTLRYLRDIKERERIRMGRRARRRVLAEHTAAHRAAELEVACLNYFRFAPPSPALAPGSPLNACNRTD